MNLTRRLFQTSGAAHTPGAFVTLPASRALRASGALGALGGNDLIKKLRAQYPRLDKNLIIDLILRYGEDEDYFTKPPAAEGQGAGPRQKYLAWMLKHLESGQLSNEFYAIELVEQFHANRKRLPVKDLYRYTPDTLVKALDSSRIARRFRTRGESNLVLEETQDYALVYLKTHGDACAYGRGTQWCISEYKPRNFNLYAKKNLGAYLLFNRNLSSKDPRYKVVLQETQGPHRVPTLPRNLAEDWNDGDRHAYITDARDNTVDPRNLSQTLNFNGDGIERLERIFETVYEHAIKQSQRPEYLQRPLHERVREARNPEELIANLELVPVEDREAGWPYWLRIAAHSVAMRDARQFGAQDKDFKFWAEFVIHSDPLVRAFAAYAAENEKALLVLAENKSEVQEVLNAMVRRPDKKQHMTLETATHLLLGEYDDVRARGELWLWRSNLAEDLYSGYLVLPRISVADFMPSTRWLALSAIARLVESDYVDTLPFAFIEAILAPIFERDDIDLDQVRGYQLMSLELVFRRLEDKLKNPESVGPKVAGPVPGIWRSLCNTPSANPEATIPLMRTYARLSKELLVDQPLSVRLKFHQQYGRVLVKMRTRTPTSLEALKAIPELEEELARSTTIQP